MSLTSVLFLCAALLMLVPTGIARIVRLRKTRHDESYKPNLKTKLNVDIVWYFGIIVLMLGVGMGTFGFMFAALLG